MDPNWKEKEGRLGREFVFANFIEALAFVNKVGAVAEEMNHHPDICIKDYKHVVISTTTHSAGSTVTEKDRALVGAIDGLS